MEDILALLNCKHGKEAPLVIHRGDIQQYLRMTINYSQAGKVSFLMEEYIDRLIAETPPTLMKGTFTTPAASHLFNVNPNATPLSTSDAVIYHHLVAKLLYLAKETWPDLLLAISFLTTHVQGPDKDDLKTLGQCIQYHATTKHLPLTLEASTMDMLQWWIDASFAVHPNCQSHTRAVLSIGCSAVYSMSSKQKLNTRSSTEAELIGINDSLVMILCVQHFLQAQGYDIQQNIIYQDNNESTMCLATNDHESSGKQTHNIDI